MTMTAVWTATAAVPSLMLTWRCRGCRRIVARLEYDGRSVLEIKHGCNTVNRLPDDDGWLRMEDRR